MALELEYKFSLNGDFPDLTELEALLEPKGFGVTEQPSREQHDQYLDTVTGVLRRSGMALRLRRFGDVQLVALKGKAEGENGLHVREELELPFSGAWPDELRDRLRGLANPDTLEPVAELVTLRQRFVLAREGRALAELSFDEVRASRPGGEVSAHFREVELEALTGDAEALTRLAGILREGLALAPNTVSKLLRASALLLTAEEITGNG